MNETARLNSGMPVEEGAATALAQLHAFSSRPPESAARSFVQAHFGAAIVWAQHRTTFRMSTTRSSATSLRYLWYETTRGHRRHSGFRSTPRKLVLG